MNPIKDINDLLNTWEIFEKEWISLYAFLLYTDEDKNIARYIREHFMELDQMSAHECLIFLIDEPSKDWTKKASTREYWNQFKIKTNCWDGFLESKPYEKHKAYEIARLFQIPIDSMPCLVFFTDINSSENAIYPLNNNWKDEEITSHLRKLFSSIVGKGESNRKKEILWNNLIHFIRKEKIKGSLINTINNPYVDKIGTLLKKIVAL